MSKKLYEGFVSRAAFNDGMRSALRQRDKRQGITGTNVGRRYRYFFAAGQKAAVAAGGVNAVEGAYDRATHFWEQHEIHIAQDGTVDEDLRADLDAADIEAIEGMVDLDAEDEGEDDVGDMDDEAELVELLEEGELEWDEADDEP